MRHVLRSRPLLLAAWLSARSRLRRAVPSAAVASILGIAGCLVVLLLWAIAPTLRTPAGRFSALLSHYQLAVAALAGAHAMLLVARQRRQRTRKHRDSWLNAAPIAEPDVRMTILLRIIAAVALQLVVTLLALFFVNMAEGVSPDPAQFLPLVGGCIFGSVIGWYLPDRTRSPHEASRYAPKTRARTDHFRASTQPLARWPVAQVLAWQRPENSRVLLLFVLFTVQGGSSIVTGLGVVAAWLLALYLASLLQATVHVARTAATWLRSTPISFVNFAWPIARGALLHQTIGTSIAVMVAVLSGMPAGMAGWLAALWLSIVACVSVVSLADSYRSRESGTKLVLSVASLIAIESRGHGWSIPAALAFVLWHLRAVTRYRESVP